MMDDFVLFLVIFYVKNSGHPVAVCKGYSFTWNFDGRSKNIERWPCTGKATSRCKAFLTMTKAREIIRVNMDHNHPVPKYIIYKRAYPI